MALGVEAPPTNPGGSFLASLIWVPIPVHLHPAFTLESLGVGVVSGEGERCQDGRRRPAGPGGVTQLCLEVSAGRRTWARLQRGREACVCACARSVLCSDSVLCTALSPTLLPRQKPSGFAMICAGFFFAATEPSSEQRRWMEVGKGVERRGDLEVWV